MLRHISMLILGLLGLAESRDRGREPPKTTSSSIIQQRNETEKFFSKVMSSHTRYCGTLGSTCKTKRYQNCYQCRECQCDAACGDYGDCCPDVALRQPPRLIHSFECLTALVQHMYEETVFDSRSKEDKKYYMVTTCPNANQELRNGCFNIVSDEPVTAMDNVTTYRNKYCALCHNVTNTSKWKLSIECSTYLFERYTTLTQLVNTSANNPNCSVKYQAPAGVTPRSCYNVKGTISTCNVTGLWSQYDKFLEEACLSYRTIKEVNGTLYNNPFCFICNTDNPQAIFTTCKWSLPFKTPSFTALLDFSDILYNDEQNRKSDCPKATIYDPEKKSCRQLSCSTGREFRNQSCQSILGVSKGSAYRIYFTLTSQRRIPLLGEDGIMEDLQANLESYFLSAVFQNKVIFPSITFYFNTTSEYGNCSDSSSQIFFSADLITVQAVHHDAFELKLLSLRNTSFVLRYDNGDIEFVTYVSEEADQMIKTSRQKSGLASCTMISSTPHNTISIAVSDYTSVDELLMCPQIILETDEFHIGADGLMQVEWINKRIPTDEYQKLYDGRVKICLENFKPITDLDRSLLRSTSTAEVLVSIMCTTLSLICLLISFIVYCRFKSLRSMPGKNNMNLIVSLFLAQLLYLSGAGRTENKGVCKAVAIFIHYFWLAAFCAMNVCSFHMFRVFTTMRSRDDSAERRRKFLQYSIYIYGMPAIIVAITMVVHIISTDGATIGYGGNVCYLSSALAIAVAFGIPVAITVVSNSLFFIITLRSIKCQPKVEKNKQDEHHSTVYVKLSTLTGITWTIGFAAIITRVEVLAYIFILANASQGLFLFISFVCNARVKKLILNGKDSSSSGYSRNGTTKTSTNVTSVSSVVSAQVNPKSAKPLKK